MLILFIRLYEVGYVKLTGYFYTIYAHLSKNDVDTYMEGGCYSETLLFLEIGQQRRLLLFMRYLLELRSTTKHVVVEVVNYSNHGAGGGSCEMEKI